MATLARAEGDVVRVMPATPDPGVLNALQGALLADPRITVPTVAVTANLVGSLLQRISVDVLILDAAFAREVGPDQFLDFLRSLAGCVAIVLVPPDLARLHAPLQQVPQVRSTYMHPVGDYAALAAEAYEHGRAERERRAQVAPAESFYTPGPIAPSQTVLGQMIVACWAIKGGTGKTSLAMNIAKWCQDHVGPTCLMGFDVPDEIGVYLGLYNAPNASTFVARPTDPGSFAACIQTCQELDVVLSVNDDRTAEELREEKPELLDQLVWAARNHVSARTGQPYGAIVLDLPPTKREDAIRPLLQANHVLLIATPETGTIIKSASSVQLLSQEFAGQHRIPTERIHLVINRMRPDIELREDGILQILREALGEQAPAVKMVIPDDSPTVTNMHNRGQLPVTKKTAFGDAVGQLCTGLFGQAPVRRGSVQTGNGLFGRIRGLGQLVEIR